MSIGQEKRRAPQHLNNKAVLVISDKPPLPDWAKIRDERAQALKVASKEYWEEQAVGRWEYLDQQGNVIIEPRFNDAWPFHEGLALVEVGGKLGYINKSGDMVIETHMVHSYELVGHEEQLFFSEGMAAYIDNENRWGYINNTGKIVVEPRFTYASPFSDGLGMVTVAGEGGEPEYGYINKNGDFVVEPQYESAAPFSEGLAWVSTGTKSFFIDTSGNIAIPSRPGLGSAFSFSEGLALLPVDNKIGYIDMNGNWAIEPQFPFDGEGAFAFAIFSDGLALVGYGYIDKTGSVAVTPPGGYYYYYPFHEGLARFGSPTQGFIDKSGKVAIELHSGYIRGGIREGHDFHEGLALVAIPAWGGTRYGFIDKTGTMVITLDSYNAKDFSEGLAAVKTPAE
jgi:hypothetical protein